MAAKLEEPTSRVDDLAHQVIGAAIEVHRILGPGPLESVYEEAFLLKDGIKRIVYSHH